MKRILITVVVFTAVTAFASGQFTHIGAGAGYATGIKEMGFGLHGMYTVNQQIKITPNLFYYLPHKITTDDGSQTFSWWVLNLDGNYVVLDEGSFQAYGLMGLSLIYLKGEQDEPPFEDTKYHYKLGLNVGAGIRLPISGKVTPFAEVRMNLGDKAYFTFRDVSTTQLGITAGILVRISRDKERIVEEY